MSNHIIELVDLTKEYDGTEALKCINLYIRQNEFITLLGPSGCGKTTTLRLIGGFERPTSGKVLFEGININDVPPYKRKVNTVFQKYALFPHMNVFENIAFGLRIKKADEKVIREKVAAMLSMVNLEGFEKRSVDSLSGGQQQRIAIARALVNEPEVLLLDEPLGALDLKLRKEMQIELKNMQKRLGITFIYVTHDQEEALSMSDTIVVMRSGVIQQIGTPQDIYNEPQNAFVADFIGESNIINGVMLQDYRVRFAGHVFDCVDKGFGTNENVDVVVRPEDIKLMHENENLLQGIVRSVIFKGVHYEMLVEDENGFEWIVQSTLMEPVDSKVGLKIYPNDIQIMKKVLVS
jgi:spermidine/putrescine transport system ATP-binding protein